MENNKATALLREVFCALRNARTIEDLKLTHAYMCGLIKALGATGCINNAEEGKLRHRVNLIFLRKARGVRL